MLVVVFLSIRTTATSKRQAVHQQRASGNCDRLKTAANPGWVPTVVHGMRSTSLGVRLTLK